MCPPNRNSHFHCFVFPDLVAIVPVQMLITDGKTQSAQFDEYAYHESLVHPALLKVASSLNAPKTVFIGGGGELATARECLRHKSVERVVMVDLDEKVVEVCKQYLPEWGGEAVLSDPRFELVIGDAHAYLLETQETFDAIIMDISDPIEAGPGVMLYTKELYEHALTRLNPHGVFVTQAGTAESIPAAENEGLEGLDPSCYSPIYNTLRSAFDCVVHYSTNIPSYGGDWGFVMAFQNPSNSVGAVTLEEDWQVPPKGFTDGLIEKQIIGGPDALLFYDGITHLSMFALSKPLRKYMKKDDRIMTRDNPIFMY
jgi:spermidine synthase